MATRQAVVEEQIVQVSARRVALEGLLTVPEGAKGIVVFAHGSGSGRFSPRNRFVADALREKGLATLLFDLLTQAEEREDLRTSRLRFNIPLLAERVEGATQWLRQDPRMERLKVGYFGASTGAAAALVAAANRPEEAAAVVSRGGRPDLAGEALGRVKAPTLFIVGGRDPFVYELNRMAMRRIEVECALEIVPLAGHLFEEPGTLEDVARLAADWFRRFLK